MEWRVLLLLAAGAGAAAACAQPGSPAPDRAVTERVRPVDQRHAEQQRANTLAREIAARIEAGTATPEADAAAAVGRGEFGLMATLMTRGGSLQAPGLACFTPRRAPPRIRALYQHGDAIEPSDTRWFDYAAAYNRALAARPDYPDADLCRPAAAREPEISLDERPATIPARAVPGPPRSLQEAARRGGAADVARLLHQTPVDTPDGLEMTALAWAVARGNGAAIEALLAAGANPWLGGEANERSAVFLAAALGRGAWFARLAGLPGRPFERWPAWHIGAATMGGDPAVLARMLGEPHEPARIEMLRHPLPGAAMIEPLLRDTPAIATPLLRRAADMESRADLVRLALTHGADPNAQPPQTGMDTPLGSAASGIWPQSLEIVDLLLRAGADPDAMSWRTRPLWRAVQTIRLDNGRAPEIAARARAVFERLRAGGADINLPDFQGRPPIWTLLFPRTYAHRELGAYFVTPALLEMLVRAGLDLNAKWEGDRVLTEVERQAGASSELAVTLRRLGARR
jgi:hypothetical protein